MVNSYRFQFALTQRTWINVPWGRGGREGFGMWPVDYIVLYTCHTCMSADSIHIHSYKVSYALSKKSFKKTEGKSPVTRKEFRRKELECHNNGSHG